ncbi:hypothetical protein B0H13DRAFT_1996052 [Mycena leptocephala]|nr:hypothetical protein B0H13DRAFT_1996052 [Mycena leptocephala]
MSNKVVPPIYRTVIDDVIASVRPAFEEFGVPEDVLQELQSISHSLFPITGTVIHPGVYHHRSCCNACPPQACAQAQS